MLNKGPSADGNHALMKKKYLPWFLFAVMAQGCAVVAENTVSLDTLAGTSWLAGSLAPTVGVGGSQPAVPRLTFVGRDQVSGNGACNAYSGKVQRDGEMLRLGPIASTRKLCPEPAMASETAFFKALAQVRKARLQGGVLELLDASDGLVLRLQRAD